MTSKLGLTIREHRNAKGWTQGQLAERLGVSQALVSQWEGGEKLPLGYLSNLWTFLEIDAEKIAHFLDRDIDLVELAIVESKKLSQKDQTVVLMLYGHFQERDSVANANAYRLRMKGK